MKVIHKTYYVCEHCGKTSLLKEEVKACQEGHRRIDENCTIIPSYKNGEPTPSALEITFADGEKHVFLRWK